MATEAPNLPDDLRIALDKAVQRIVEIAQPELVILFGSWAEGNAREDSDVDLMVVSETDDCPLLAARLREEIRPLLGDRGLDLLVMPREHWPEARRIRGMVAWEADRFGVRLHERAA
ncbi:MAG: nucleotidyltransferase domain-containing protein [Armatimonadetes bacterium]|nr:nucleotidyltransferase domain-containing protein [Armatimonadota bacterium]